MKTRQTKPPFPRKRVRTNVRTHSFTRTIHYAGGTSTTTAAGNAAVGVREVCCDVVTPGFRELSARGAIINNPFTRYRERFGYVAGGYSHVCNYSQGPLVLPRDAKNPDKDTFQNLMAWKLGPQASQWNDAGNYLRRSLITDAQVSDLVTLASTRALSNFNKSYAQGLVTLAELRKTIELLRSPVSSLLAYIRKPWRHTIVETRNLRGKGRVVTRRSVVIDPVSEIIPLGNAAASQYLSWYYGMRPMMRDIAAIAEAIKKARTVRHRTSAEAEVSGSTSKVLPLHFGSALKESYYRLTVNESVKVEAGLMFTPTELSLLDSLGLSLSAVPLAVFELIPWSFTTGWVSNLSDFVNSLAVSYSRDIRCSWLKITTTGKVERTAEGNTVTDPNWSVIRAPSDSDFYTYEEVRRSPANLADTSGVVWHSPDNVPAIAAACLAIQQLTSIKVKPTIQKVQK